MMNIDFIREEITTLAEFSIGIFVELLSNERIELIPIFGNDVSTDTPDVAESKSRGNHNFDFRFF